jgi:hypothetical protein
MRFPAALCLLLVLAGCVGGPAATPTADTGTATPAVATPRPTPDPPANRTPTRVASFAREYERAAVHNAAVAAGAVDVSLDCEAAVDRDTPDATYVLAACEGTVERSADDGLVRTERPPRPAIYRVDEADVSRAGVTNRRTATPLPRGEGTGVTPRDVRVANFDGERHEVRVTVAHVNGGVRLRRTLRVPAGEALTLRDVVDRTGTYLVRVHVGYRTVQRHWLVGRPNGTPDRQQGAFGVYVGPDEEVTLGAGPRLGL